MTRAKSKPASGRARKWILRINLFFVLLLLLTYITPFVSPESWSWLTLLTLMYPVLLLINAIFAGIWIFSGHVYSLFSLAVLLIGFGHHSRYVKLFSLPDDTAQCTESIQLMTYNMRGLNMVPAKKGVGVNEKIELLHEALSEREAFPDILCIQEGTKGEQIAIRFGLDHCIHGPKSSLWIASRYPVISHGVLPGEENSTSCMWADIKTPSGTIRVYNMHLVSNRVTHTAAELIEGMDLQNQNTWSNIKFIISRYKKTTGKRAKEARALRDHMQDCKYPVIIAGDGNDTPLSHTYHILSDGMKDSFRQRGYGVSTTYESKLPMLRIDYFFGSKEVSFKEHHTLHLNYSDHYPVTTGICLKGRTSS